MPKYVEYAINFRGIELTEPKPFTSDLADLATVLHDVSVILTQVLEQYPGRSPVLSAYTEHSMIFRLTSPN